MKKKIVIFGATGGTGQQLVKQAIEEGLEVTAFVRNPAKLEVKDTAVKVIQGNVLAYEDVVNAIEDQDIVMCSLGMPAFDKSTLRADGTANIVKAMQAKGVKRLICQSSLGFGDSKALLPWHMKYFIVPFILKNAFKDHALQESIIEQSDLDWTIVRPGNMTDGIKTENYQHGFSATQKVQLKISRADVANFMLRQINFSSYLYQKVGISY